MATLIKTDRNGTKYWLETKCPKCGGSGVIPYYYHVDGGVCFHCGGSGRYESVWKEYTPEYESKLAAKRKVKLEAKRAKALEEAAEKRITWLLNHGFTAEGITEVFVGNTFWIKDDLKALGSKFMDNLGWHIAENKSSFQSIQISIDDIMDINDWGSYFWKDINIAGLIKSKLLALGQIKESNFIGSIGDKVEPIVTHERSFFYETQFGTTWIHKFIDEEGNIFVWKTSSTLTEEPVGQFILKGTIKDHAEYNGEKQTMVIRCKILKKVSVAV